MNLSKFGFKRSKIVKICFYQNKVKKNCPNHNTVKIENLEMKMNETFKEV